jgi:hypothetical protein
MTSNQNRKSVFSYLLDIEFGERGQAGEQNRDLNGVTVIPLPIGLLRLALGCDAQVNSERHNVAYARFVYRFGPTGGSNTQVGQGRDSGSSTTVNTAEVQDLILLQFR